MDRLIVKNFGPLKDVDIELNKINLFIGENGSGKSVLAKLVTIFFDIELSEEKDLLKKFEEYQINFLSEKSVIEYYPDGFIENEVFIKIKNKKIIFSKFHKKHKSLLNESRQLQEKLANSLKELEEVSRKKLETLPVELKEKVLNFLEENETAKEYKNELEPKYIPAERNLISLFNQSIYSFLTADIPIPKFIISYFSEFEKARNEIKELSFLNVKYVNADKDRIYFNENEFLNLEHSSSGIQSALPLYLTVKYFANKYYNIIIEEPEQNLFPKAQKETIQYIIEQISDKKNLFMMTHSPYVLSTLNILMMAYKAGNLNDESKKEVIELFNEKQWINPNKFSAYYLENGIARDIKGRTGLISENEIDEISNDIQDEFEELLAIYREHKNDK